MADDLLGAACAQYPARQRRAPRSAGRERPDAAAGGFWDRGRSVLWIGLRLWGLGRVDHQRRLHGQTSSGAGGAAAVDKV